MTGRSVLVLGAREGSLGAYVKDVAIDRSWEVTTAGISGEEDFTIDVTKEPGALRRLMEAEGPEAVVCTIGVNTPRGVASADLAQQMSDSFAANVIAPMTALRMAMGVGSIHQFVAISSNSAQIARRGSIPYCASKAALSMALRVAAREMGGSALLVYGYEFGLLQGTPMTREIEGTFEGPLTRIPGAPSGLSTAAAAVEIMMRLEAPWQGLNGTMIRLDGGEQ